MNTTRQARPFAPARRRTLKILAAAGGALAWPLPGLGTGSAPPPFSWRGTALGARASLTLYHVDAAEGRRLVRRIGDEVRRLERVFSLYRRDSVVVALNSSGIVRDPPLDLVRVLADAQAISDATHGAFDVSVQPLWRAYAAHFSAASGPRAGPGQAVIDTALELVGYRHIDIGPAAIRFTRPGMAVTLNGIAQGYVTDRIAALLRREGLRNVLIDLGEIRALDRHPSGRALDGRSAGPIRPRECERDRGHAGSSRRYLVGCRDPFQRRRCPPPPVRPALGPVVQCLCQYVGGGEPRHHCRCAVDGTVQSGAGARPLGARCVSRVRGPGIARRRAARDLDGLTEVGDHDGGGLRTTGQRSVAQSASPYHKSFQAVSSAGGMRVGMFLSPRIRRIISSRRRNERLP